jgi:hypothetical protein
VDGNGLVNSTDYETVKAVFQRKETLTAYQTEAADADGNGTVNTTDYLRIRSHALGKFNLYN